MHFAHPLPSSFRGQLASGPPIVCGLEWFGNIWEQLQLFGNVKVHAKISPQNRSFSVRSGHVLSCLVLSCPLQSVHVWSSWVF